MRTARDPRTDPCLRLPDHQNQCQALSKLAKSQSQDSDSVVKGHRCPMPACYEISRSRGELAQGIMVLPPSPRSRLKCDRGISAGLITHLQSPVHVFSEQFKQHYWPIFLQPGKDREIPPYKTPSPNRSANASPARVASLPATPAVQQRATGPPAQLRAASTFPLPTRPSPPRLAQQVPAATAPAQTGVILPPPPGHPHPLSRGRPPAYLNTSRERTPSEERRYRQWLQWQVEQKRAQDPFGTASLR